MYILREAIASLQRNASALFLYIAVTVGIDMVNRGCQALLIKPVFGEADAAPLRVYSFVAELAIAVCYATAQAVAFARIGRDIDRPLWKITTDREALKRFFTLWFILNLLVLVTQRLPALATKPDSPWIAAVTLAFLLLLMLGVPVGACIMFSGRFTWTGAPASLAPLLYELPKTLMVLLLNVGQLGLAFQFLDILDKNKDTLAWVWVTPAFGVLFGFLDCFVFAGIWLICREHRDKMKDIDLGF